LGKYHSAPADSHADHLSLPKFDIDGLSGRISISRRIDDPGCGAVADIRISHFEPGCQRLGKPDVCGNAFTDRDANQALFPAVTSSARF
jgi:hypothetical protein